MAFAILALAPSLAAVEAPQQRLALLCGVFRRFFLLVWHAMPAVLLSGWALLFVWYGGFRGAGWHVHLMHLTGLVMGAVYLTIALGPWREMRAALAAGETAAAAGAAGRIRQLVTLNLALGLLTVAVAAWGRFGG
ncbi:CopD family protein [Caldovatus sp. SYSU G05006]|uniref:CopD family protein n=2 Tax=Caldovatus aquaticus TaxID=2865671 RepID=A0ABS7F1H1_9PROT|nr:CopD family protein [Caldovatus aquaticus]MBW8268630.1 CopD family protein [Caldovatus aquaticus]